MSLSTIQPYKPTSNFNAFDVWRVDCAAIDEDIHEPKDVLLPTWLVVRVARQRLARAPDAIGIREKGIDVGP
jgi:hypothetical protein